MRCLHGGSEDFQENLDPGFRIASPVSLTLTLALTPTLTPTLPPTLTLARTPTLTPTLTLTLILVIPSRLELHVWLAYRSNFSTREAH